AEREVIDVLRPHAHPVLPWLKASRDALHKSAVCWDAATPAPAPDLMRIRYTWLPCTYAGLAAGLQPMLGVSDASFATAAPCYTFSRRERECNRCFLTTPAPNGSARLKCLWLETVPDQAGDAPGDDKTRYGSARPGGLPGSRSRGEFSRAARGTLARSGVWHHLRAASWPGSY